MIQSSGVKSAAMNDNSTWSSQPASPQPPIKADDTQPRIIRPLKPRKPIGLYALTGCLGLIVITCACLSFVLASIGSGTLLALRDRWFGHDTGTSIKTIVQVVQVMTGNSDVWPVPNNGRVVILLLGVDTRGHSVDDPTRSDVIMLVTIDPATNSAAMLSVPRDLYVPLPNLNVQDRINTAYFWGEANKLPGGGAGYAKETIGWNLGVPIHKFGVIDFNGFKAVIDSIGGIDVDVPHEIIDDEYPTEDYRTERLVIPAGTIHMDGALALKYVRTRHQDSDFGRLQRQQQVILAIRNKALSIGSIGKVPEVLNTLGDSLQTDLTLPEILTLAKKWTSIPKENIHTYQIDQTMTTSYVTPEGGYVLLPDRAKIGSIVAQFLGQVTSTATQP
jgi:LCP family protein required for cell wall assembly